jgi:hypothetical protein
VPPLSHTVRRTDEVAVVAERYVVHLSQRFARVPDSALGCAAISLAVVHLLAWSAEAVTWHVPSEVSTIHAALDSASAGDTVLVAPGVYPVTADHETWNYVPTGVCFTSETGPETTVLEVCDGLPIAISNAEGARVSGFTIRFSFGPNCEYGFPIIAIDCWNSTDVIVENCIIEDLGIGIHVAGTSSQWWWPVFRDNVIRRCRVGIESANTNDAGRPYFLRNIVTESSNAGAVVYNSSPLFDSNEFTGGLYGMYYEGACCASCWSNKICDNAADGVVIYPNPELAAPDFNGGLLPWEANDFSGNGGYAIYNGYYHPTTSVFAEFNYWGSRCPDSTRLFYGPVDISPWVDSTHTEILNADDCPDATRPATGGSIKALFKENED